MGVKAFACFCNIKHKMEIALRVNFEKKRGDGNQSAKTTPAKIKRRGKPFSALHSRRRPIGCWCGTTKKKAEQLPIQISSKDFAS